MPSSNLVVLGLGSNKPFGGLSPIQLLDKACIQLQSLLSRCTVSSMYKTKPMYVEDQAYFYNMAVSGFFQGSPNELLESIHKIEAHFGRNRLQEIRNGARTLDIDIELFGSEIIKTENLQIPHPRLCERAFVLVPLLEILPDCADVISGKPYAEFASKLSHDDIQEVQYEPNRNAE